MDRSVDLAISSKSQHLHGCKYKHGKRASKPNKLASTHRQIVLNEAEDNVSADENSCASDASAAVNSDWPLVVHRPQVADEANQLLRALRHTMVRPVCELQVTDKMGLTSLE